MFRPLPDEIRPLALKIVIKKEILKMKSLTAINRQHAFVTVCMGIGSVGQGVMPLLDFHTYSSTNKVEGGLMMLFLILFFPLLPPPPWKFFCRRPWQYVLEF